MKTTKPNIMDNCLHKAGFRSKNNNPAIAGLFEEFRTYKTQVFEEVEEYKLHVLKKDLSSLVREERSSIYLWSGSAGETAEQSLYFVEFSDSTIEMAKPDYISGSNYAYTETIREDGESISELHTRIGKDIRRVVHLVWNYSEWTELERYREVTIYS